MIEYYSSKNNNEILSFAQKNNRATDYYVK